MALLEERHWWFQGSRRVVLSLLEPLLPQGLPLLDVGCGTGLTLALLEHRVGIPTASLSGVDVSMDALAIAATRTGARLTRSPASRLQFADGQFGIVTLLDVLEHVEDDDAAMLEAARVLRPRGFVLATVPAHPALFSTHDQALGHHRRYRESGLRRLAAMASLEVCRLTPCNCLLSPPIALVRLAKRHLPGRGGGPSKSDLALPPQLLNSLLAALFSAEARLLKLGDLPFGISWLALFRKV